MQNKKRRYFPKQLFFRFVGSQLLLSLPLLLLASLGSRYYIAKKIGNYPNAGEILPTLNYTFLFLISIVLMIFVGISLFMGYRLILPLGRIIAKARSITKREEISREEAEEASTKAEDIGEWFDLENALNRIRSDMAKQDRHRARDREEIEAIISAISAAVIAIDKSGNILFYNSQFAILFAEKDFQQKQSRLGELFRTPDVLETFHRAIRETKNIHCDVQILLHDESTPRHFALSVAPIYKGKGDIYGVVGVFHDVTELKLTDQVRIDFVANVSHELRTPLTSIKGYAQTLKLDLLDNNLEIADKHIDIITKNVDRLIALVSDLLNLSSIESGGTDLEIVPVHLRELTDRVLNSLEEKRNEKDQRISVKYEVESLAADSQRLEQVLYNLVENAIKYAPAHKTIEILWQKNSVKDEISLHVRDDGPGIPVEHHPRLFERFYRVDQARSRSIGGTGLGLSIVKHIMQRHGGSVRVQGGLGKGTEFICSFPFKQRNI